MSDDTHLDIYIFEPDYEGLQGVMIDLCLPSFSELMLEAIRLTKWMEHEQSEYKATVVALTDRLCVIDPDFDFLRPFKPPLPRFDMDRYSVDPDIEIIERADTTPIVQIVWEAGPVFIQALDDLRTRLKLDSRDEAINACLGALQWALEKRTQGCALFAVTQDDLWHEPKLEMFRHLAPAMYNPCDIGDRLAQQPSRQQSRPN